MKVATKALSERLSTRPGKRRLKLSLAGSWVGGGGYHLTILFAITAVVAIAAAVLIVIWVIGDLAETNLVRISEENTARDAAHIQSMMRGGHSMDAVVSDGGRVDGGMAMQEIQQPMAHDMQSVDDTVIHDTMSEMH